VSFVLRSAFVLASLIGAASGAVADEPSVRVRLLADASGIAPGGSCLVAARLEIAKGWHVYWKNPGDTGLATTLEVKAPDGFAIGEVLYPGPDRIELPGDVVTFGWERSAALFVRVTAPKSIAVGAHAALAASVSWLACKESCVPGSAEATLDLAVIDSPSPANAELLEPHRRRLPRPQSELSGLALTWSGPPAKPTLTIVVAGEEAIELFPDRAAYATLVRRSRSGTSATYGFEFEGRERPPDLTGVLAANRKGEWTYTEVRFAWPK
jgi:DsbC/DsbD-like thiol-disulfide interchange protein